MGSVSFVAIVVLLGAGAASFVRGVSRQRTYRRLQGLGETLSPVVPRGARRVPKAPRAVPEGRRRLDIDGLVSLSVGTVLVPVTGALVLDRMGLSRVFAVGLPVAVVAGALIWLYTERD